MSFPELSFWGILQGHIGFSGSTDGGEVERPAFTILVIGAPSAPEYGVGLFEIGLSISMV
jgi:hypothetical protein